MRNRVEITVTNSDGSIAENREILNDFTFYGLERYNSSTGNLAYHASTCTLSDAIIDYTTSAVSSSGSVNMNTSTPTYPNEDIVVDAEGKRYIEVHTAYVSPSNAAGVYNSMMFGDYNNRAFTYVNFPFPLTLVTGQSATIKYVRYLQIPEYIDATDYLDTPIVVPVAQGVLDINLLDTSGEIVDVIPKNYSIYMPTNISTLGSSQASDPFQHLINMVSVRPSYLQMLTPRRNYFRIFGENSPNVVLANSTNVIGGREIYVYGQSANLYQTNLVNTSYNYFGQSYTYSLAISPDAHEVNELNIKSLACAFFGDTAKTGSTEYCGLEYDTIKDKTIRDMLVYDYSNNFNSLGGWIEFDEPLDILPNQGISINLVFTTNWMPPKAFLDEFPDWELGD